MTKIGNFSVIVPVYVKDRVEFLIEAINSILQNQTLQPNEVLIVVDGPIVEDLKNAIDALRKQDSRIRIEYFPINRGLGSVLRDGVALCSNELIARMDSDDYSTPTRFELQYQYMMSHPDCAIVGGQMCEFIDNINNVVGMRYVPEKHSAILKRLKSRCPLNHITVMFRKSKILEAGNYIEWHYNEDYYLWIRMAELKMEMTNLPNTLAYARVGKEMYQRRGGWKYFKSEKGLQDYMLSHKIISLPQYLFNVAVRFGVQVAMPNKVRGFIFQKLFRK